MTTRVTKKNLPKGAIKETAEIFHTSICTVQRIWWTGKNSETREEAVAEHRSKKKICRCNNLRAGTAVINLALQKTPLLHRRTFPSDANVLVINSDTPWNILQPGNIRSVSNYKRPFLTPEIILAGIILALSNVNQTYCSKATTSLTKNLLNESV